MKKIAFVLSLFATLLAFGAGDIVLPEGWEDPVGAQGNMSLFAQVLDWDDNYVTTDGSALGVFDADGVCRGTAGISEGPNNSLLFKVIVASSATAESQELFLKVLDPSDGEIHDLQETLSYVDDARIGSLSEPVVFHYTPRLVEQELTLNQNWNWISFYVQQGENTFDDFLADYAQYATDGDTIKGQNDYVTFSEGTWYPSNEEFKLEPGRMYKLFKQSADTCTITVTGVIADPAQPIPVVAGWNWIGYPVEFPSTIGAIYMEEGFADDDMIKQQVSDQVVFSGTKWWGNLEFNPGMGYMLYVSEDGTIDFRNAEANIIE